MSRHLRLLEDAGLIKSSKDGTRVYYTVVDPHIYNLVDSMDEEVIKLISQELAKKIGV